MTLYFDTTNKDGLMVELRQGKHIVAKAEGERSQHYAQQLLPTIDRLLREQGKSLSELTAIEVNPGPGSYTGTRVGVAVANALGLALGISVNGLEVGEGVAPVYAAEPFITKPRG
jgi:tRNA threonylcarbamoyladenosine biosynthesis protein TsaB